MDTLANSLSNMDVYQLMRLRDQYANNPQMQAYLGPYEHRAFARQWTKDSPVMASLSLPFAIPLYTAAKAVDQGLGTNFITDQSTSPASLSEIMHAYKGWLEGLR